MSGAEHRLAEVVERIQSEALETIIIGFCDINGVFRGKHIPASRFVDDPTGPIQFSDIVYGLDIQDQPIEPGDVPTWWPLAEGGFRDILVLPDMETFLPLPWRTSAAVVLGDVRYRDGTELPVDPRSLLKRIAERSIQSGWTPRAAAELEFILLREDQASLARKGYNELQRLAERRSAYGVERLDADEHVVGRFLDWLKVLGINSWNVEGGISQYEFNWEHGDIVAAADRAFLFKWAMREIARRLDVTVTFMAKFDETDLGSSLHVHQSLWSRDGRNLFHDPASTTGLSEQALSYIAGLLATMRELSSLVAPTVNSYKRYVPGASAGVNATWAMENPLAGVRPIVDGEEGTRVELRTPGSDANPYLALAASLSGGLWGLERGLTAPDQTPGDASAVGDVERMPEDLESAVESLRKSDVAAEMFGEVFVEYYAATRAWEAERFRSVVTDWERRRYLTLA